LDGLIARSGKPENFVQLNVCSKLPKPGSDTQKAMDGAAIDTILQQIDPTTLRWAGLDKSELRKTARLRGRLIEPPLGWSLSAAASDWMDWSLGLGDGDKNGDCFQKNAYAIQRLTTLFRSARPKTEAVAAQNSP
jgi:hypothetical protein